MRLRIKFLLFVAIGIMLTGILIPQGYSYAQPCGNPEEGIAGIDFLHFRKAIVPCGRHCDDARTAYIETQYCTLCHLMIMAKNIFDLLLAWLIIVALIFITIAGVVYMLSTGNPGMKTLAKNILIKTLTGFSLFVLSWLIVYTALVFFSAENVWGLDSTDWFVFDCNEQSSPFN